MSEKLKPIKLPFDEYLGNPHSSTIVMRSLPYINSNANTLVYIPTPITTSTITLPNGNPLTFKRTDSGLHSLEVEFQFNGGSKVSVFEKSNPQSLEQRQKIDFELRNNMGNDDVEYSYVNDGKSITYKIREHI